MMFYDLSIIVLLCVAVGSGLYTIHRNADYWKSFTCAELFQCQTLPVIYVLVVLSTSLCVVDIAFRLQWAVEMGWEHAGGVWAFKWLVLHAGIAGNSTMFHVIANRLLRDFPPTSKCHNADMEGAPRLWSGRQ